MSATSGAFETTRSNTYDTMTGQSDSALKYEAEGLNLFRDRDLADFVHSKLELEKAREDADAASLVKSRFLATLSHELRTPLNSVIGFTNVLLKNTHGHLSSQDLDYLRRIESNGTHLLTLINDILDLSKIEAGKVDVVVEPVSLKRVVSDVLSQIEGTDTVQTLTLSSLVPRDAAPVLADAGRLKQVLLNLVANAVKFTDHGSVTVSVITEGHSNEIDGGWALSSISVDARALLPSRWDRNTAASIS